MEPIKAGQVRWTRYHGRERIVKVIMESIQAPGYWVVEFPGENRTETLPAWAFERSNDNEPPDPD
ncbi:MAG TPA: hypothetical protein VGX76_21085 [Pirellulales bacterium]|jgi:hypothetical protein|nr:hypothetical protein [Pirellulales bacterium]